MGFIGSSVAGWLHGQANGGNRYQVITAAFHLATHLMVCSSLGALLLVGELSIYMLILTSILKNKRNASVVVLLQRN